MPDYGRDDELDNGDGWYWCQFPTPEYDGRLFVVEVGTRYGDCETQVCLDGKWTTEWPAGTRFWGPIAEPDLEDDHA